MEVSRGGEVILVLPIQSLGDEVEILFVLLVGTADQNAGFPVPDLAPIIFRHRPSSPVPFERWRSYPATIFKVVMCWLMYIRDFFPGLVQTPAFGDFWWLFVSWISSEMLTTLTFKKWRPVLGLHGPVNVGMLSIWELNSLDPKSDPYL